VQIKLSNTAVRTSATEESIALIFKLINSKKFPTEGNFDTCGLGTLSVGAKFPMNKALSGGNQHCPLLAKDLDVSEIYWPQASGDYGSRRCGLLAARWP
jgi:hypothetical protein